MCNSSQFRQGSQPSNIQFAAQSYNKPEEEKFDITEVLHSLLFVNIFFYNVPVRRYWTQSDSSQLDIVQETPGRMTSIEIEDMGITIFSLAFDGIIIR